MAYVHALLAFSPNAYLKGLVVALYSSCKHFLSLNQAVLHFHLMALSNHVKQAHLFTRHIGAHMTACPISLGVLDDKNISWSIFPRTKFFHQMGHWNLMHHVYPSRIFPSLGRVIILDSDVLVLEDLSNLWHACKTMSRQSCSAPGLCAARGASWSLTSDRNMSACVHAVHGEWPSRSRDGTEAFATGVQVTNLQAFQQCDRMADVRTTMQHCNATAVGTKRLLNVVYFRKTWEIDARWNRGHGSRSDGECPPGGIVHFSASPKPWDDKLHRHKHNSTPCFLLWREYFQQATAEWNLSFVPLSSYPSRRDREKH